MNLGNILRGAVRAAKQNPEIALAVAGLVSPKLVTKIAPVIVAAVTKPKA